MENNSDSENLKKRDHGDLQEAGDDSKAVEIDLTEVAVGVSGGDHVRTGPISKNWMLITDNAANKLICNVKRDKRVKWKKKIWLNVKTLAGQEIPNYFKTTRDGLVMETDVILGEKNEEYRINDDQKTAEQSLQEKMVGGNETIYISDRDQTQKLTMEDITQMKDDKVAGREIAEMVLKNNANFEKRTEFSQLKLIKRKKQKYETYFLVEPVSIWNAVEYWIETKPKDVAFLREDSFALFMQYADINPDSHVYVCEKSKGAILSSALMSQEKDSGGAAYLSDFKNAGTFNLNNYVIVQYLGLYDRSKDLLEILDFDKAMEFNQSQRELSHILIANEISEVEILETCADRLVGGGKIVIYQRSLAALERVAEWLFGSGRYQNVNVVDSWMRRVQVQPKRTHPEMAGETFGGYILTAYKVDLDF